MIYQTIFFEKLGQLFGFCIGVDGRVFYLITFKHRRYLKTNLALKTVPLFPNTVPQMLNIGVSQE